ncbi:hypothetical protein AYL99_04021 [Fonsecaea erecta]|uniref:Peroxisomal trans-2-enoyl-CoA reductase n=1 Tax=Fonsecaea erecta TaxID=1367422 RepID=A0A178ZPR2_9EURO|nr:hypothetical protein AYL99_04021 [Fonsecaea erecta]OAP61818.1 hypothetical protein AYL99_04021 [Fonsecaea erecta]
MPNPMTLQEESDHFSPYRTDGKLYGFVCVVTGANMPVGAAIVTELAAHGAACIYACAATDQPSNIQADLSKLYPNTKVISYPYSISSEQDTLVLIDEALNAWGRLDVWVCSSGLLGPPSIDQTTPQDLQKCFEANSLAPFFALKYAPHAMQKTTSKGNYPNAAPKDQRYGSIIVVTSTASTYGGCWGPCFTMSCHAAMGVVRSGVAVLKGTGVRINAISPGQIDVGVSLNGLDTKSTLMGYNTQLPPAALQSPAAQKNNIGLERAGTPAEVGRVAGFLASGFSSYITGANMIVDGGASVMCPLMVPI